MVRRVSPFSPHVKGSSLGSQPTSGAAQHRLCHVFSGCLGGPKLPLADAFKAAPQLRQTSHSFSAQHLRTACDSTADQANFRHGVFGDCCQSQSIGALRVDSMEVKRHSATCTEGLSPMAAFGSLKTPRDVGWRLVDRRPDELSLEVNWIVGPIPER